jgi:transcription antitermination factor NusG
MLHWSAIYTRSRNEKKVAERLNASGIKVYCPTQTTLKQWSDRKKKVTEPIFKSYVFVQYKDELFHTKQYTYNLFQH